jgi:hypothetical protein
LNTARHLIEEIKETNKNQNPETEVILSIVAENVEYGFGKTYWNQRLQGNFIRSLIECLRYLINGNAETFCHFDVKRFGY